MPPARNIIWARSFHTSFPGNPGRKPIWLDARPHEGAWRKPPNRDIDMKLEDAGSPRWGARCANYWAPFMSLHPLLWLLWVVLTRLGGFCPQTLSFGRPHGNPQTHFRYSCRIPWCIGHVVWGVRWCIRSFLLRLFTMPAEPICFAFSVVTLWGYKVGGHSYDLKNKRDVIEPPPKWGVHLPRSYCGILSEVGMRKHNT
jgi:hypothetical protein